MIITLSGVTGSGKSYFKKIIQEEFGLDNQIIYTTRPIRTGEINGVDKYFVTDKEFDNLEKNKSIIATFEYLGYRYGYESNKIKSNNKSIVEVHYEIIDKLKKEARGIFSVYIIPNSIETAKKQLKKRHLDKEQEELRLKEIEEQYSNFKNNKDIQKQFDYVLYNNYDEISTNKLIEIIKNRIEN